MKRLKSIFFLSVVGLVTSGCMGTTTLALIDSDNKICNPQTFKKAHYLHASLPYLKKGSSQHEVIRAIGVPEKKSIKRSKQGTMDVYSYRTGDEACDTMPTDQLYTYLYFKNNALVGYISN